MQYLQAFDSRLYIDNILWGVDKTIYSKEGASRFTKLFLSVMEFLAHPAVFPSMKNAECFTPIKTLAKDFDNISSIYLAANATCEVVNSNPSDLVTLKGSKKLVIFGFSMFTMIPLIRELQISDLSFLGWFGEKLGTFTIFGYVIDCSVDLTLNTMRNGLTIFAATRDAWEIAREINSAIPTQGTLNAIISILSRRSTYLLIALDTCRVAMAFLAVPAGVPTLFLFVAFSMGDKFVCYAQYLDRATRS